MSNLIPFPVLQPDPAPDAGAAFLDEPAPHAHGVQFYESDSFLVDTVGKFLAAGLAAGDQLLVFATPEHRQGFMERLSAVGVDRAVAAGQVIALDARETLSRFMVGDMPDPDLFHDVVGRLLSKMREGRPRVHVRAYGEMVDLLWKDGNSRAAIRLEELWNETSKAHPFSLLCAYVMGNFYREGDASRFMEVCRTHTHVIPTEAFTELDDSHARLREISLLQQRARALENEIQHRRELESALRDALRERGRVEDDLRDAVRRETQARERAEANDAFKEMFLGILGHDLRNPLNTILATVQLMKLRGDLPVDSSPRIDRVISSGLRMERMIQQLLDVARARLAGGIPIAPSNHVDLVSLVNRMGEELQAAHPEYRIVIRAPGPCRANVDADRVEQVVSNLLGNAINHGDHTRPVTVEVLTRGRVASISVHNFGVPIDAPLTPILFDPFKRGERSNSQSDGLGLGLYIAERIVSAHGGKIEFESTLSGGTRFEVIFPLEAE